MKRKPLALAVVLLCLALPFVGWRVWLAHDVNSRLAAIRKAGLPTDGKTANEWYAAVPTSQNAALVLTQAFALFRNYSDSRSNAVWDFKLPKRGERLSAEQAELLRGYVEMNSAAIAKGDEALKLPASRYPLDLSQLANTPLPHLTSLKQLAELNQYKAWLALQAGEKERASAGVEAILGLARTLDKEPCIISQMVRLRLLKMAVATLERRVNAGSLSAAEATNLATAFARTATTNCMVRALIGERALYGSYFRLSREEAARLTPPRKADTGEFSPLPYKGPFALRAIGYYELDFRWWLGAMETSIELANLPPPDNLATDRHFARAGAQARKRSHTMSAVLLGNLPGVAAREVEGVAYHRMATTALAIEQFRNQRGKLPEDLDELVPALIHEIPEDPFTGAELEYRRKEKGYLLYSVGRDGKDDGGREAPEKKSASAQQTYDLPFVVER